MSDPAPNPPAPPPAEPDAPAPGTVPPVPEDALVRGEAYQAAQRVSPWGYVFFAGVAGLLTGFAWYKVEDDTGYVTQAWIFLAALATLAPIAWHAVDFFQSVASRRGGAFLAVLLTVTLGCVAMVAVSALNLAKKTSLPSLDLTESGRYTLGDETQKILRRIPDGARIYATYLMRSGPQSRTRPDLRAMAIEQLEVYPYASPAVTVKVFDDFRDKEAADQYLRTVGVVSTSTGETDDVIVLTYAEAGREVATGKQKEIQVVESAFGAAGAADGLPRWLGERVITSGIQELVFTRLKAYATGGHGERGLTDEMRELRDRLTSQNVEVVDKPLDLVSAPNVPADANLVLILDPQGPFQPSEVQALSSWLDQGNALFVALDVDMAGRRRETGLEPLLDRFGLAPRINYLVIAPNLLQVEGGQGSVVKMTTELWIASRDYGSHPAVDALRRGGGFRTVFPDASYLEVDAEPAEGLTVDPIVWAPDPGVKDARPWAARLSPTRRDIKAPVPGEDKTGVRLAIVAAAKLDLAGAAAGTRKDARLVLSGDADAFADGVTRQNAPNLDLFGGLAQWCLHREDLVAVSEKTMEIERADIGPREHRMALWWPLVTALSALLAGALVAWSRRR